MQVEKTLIPVTCSIGVASNEEIPMIDAGALIRSADDALYKAKEQGRNCVVKALPDQQTVR